MELTPEEDPKPAENERRKYKEKENKNSGSRRRRSRSRSKSRSKSRSRSRSRKNGRKRDRDSQRNDNGNSDNEIVGERFYGNYQRRDQRYQRKRGYESQDEMEIGERYYGGSRGYSRRKSRSRSRERFKDHSRRDREDGRRRKDYRGNGKEFEKSDEKEDERAKDKENNENSTIPPAQKRTVDLLTSRTGGAYIPPAKLRMMQAEITDKSGEAYQRIAWEALKKSIHGYINKVNTSNIGIITRELLRENIVRGRGLLARSIIQAQAASPTFTPVYAALAAVINSKFPNIGELLLKRLVIQFKQGFRRNDKTKCISSGTFIAHLVNQKVAHEILALEILTLLVHTPTDDSVEVAIALLKECGMRLTEVCRKGMEAIFEMLRHILHEGLLDKRVQYMIEVIFQIRKDEFKDHEAIPEELDLVEEENQFTHVITLDEAVDSQGILDVFKADSEYVTNEDKYKQLIKEILDTDDSDSNDEGDDEGDSSDEDSDAANDENKEDVIVDNTETNLTTLRRTIYLTIHSSLDFEECAHKLMKIQLKPGQEIELCHMFLDCCAENRTYEKFYGLLAGRFCAINKMYVTPFEQIFKTSYDTIHRLDTNKLRNVSKFFAHLLYTDSISWEVLSCIRLNEEETTSSSRVFIKILFQELSEYMGLSKLNQRVKDITLQTAFDGLFPRDDPKNTRFAINFFTSIGLGGLTDDLREHLKSQPKTSAVPPIIPEKNKSSSSDSPSSSSSSSSSSSESESSSDSSSSTSSSSSSSSSEESSEDEKRRRKKKTSKKESKKIVEKVDKKAEKSRRRKSKDNSKKRDSKNEHKKKKKNK